MSKPPFRLAIRDEGEFVNCYFATAGTMAGATLLASMRKTILDNHPEIFQEWKLLMTEAFRVMLTTVMEKALGKPVAPGDIEFIDQAPPEGDAKQ